MVATGPDSRNGSWLGRGCHRNVLGRVPGLHGQMGKESEMIEICLPVRAWRAVLSLENASLHPVALFIDKRYTIPS